MSDSQAAKIIARIQSGDYSEQELINLWKNASERGEVAVMDAVKRRMRTDFPRTANRMFGAKEAEAIALLEKVSNELAAEFPLQDNRLKNGVKIGGTMLSGKRHIDVYISYKTAGAVGVFLGLVQEDSEAELMATVGHYKTGEDSFRNIDRFAMDEFDRAVARYKAELAALLLQSS